ncbi:MAG: CehA/McbA family metallohydrolase [Gammaproteobacteria bacterium]|nr:CehA/McbA family metallohydrolase [Gammaproteobacteria bacterium]
MGRAGWILGLCMGLCACGSREARFVEDIPWRAEGHWLIADLHSHSRYSDGTKTPQELAAMARRNGCDVLAITDHGDRKVKTLSPEFFAELVAARQAEPALVMMVGLEWNVPPYQGREHMGILPGEAAREALIEFRRRFEAEGATAEEALRWLAQTPATRDAVLIYNHPSRADKDAGENERDLKAWRGLNPALSILEGGPGHQGLAPDKAYTGIKPMVDGWDAAVAEVGGVWDAALDRGEPVWGALASSDYHNPAMDREPCAFGRTHFFGAGRSETEILAALRAGSFWAEQGRLLKSLDFRIEAKGLGGPALPGSTLAAPADAPLHLHIAAQPEATWPLDIEIIGNGLDGKAAVLHTGRLSAKFPELFWQPPPLKPGADGRSAYFRVRISGMDAEGTRRVAYSNAIRVRVE